MLAEVGEDEVVRDGRHRVQARLAELRLDVVLFRESKAAVRVDRDPAAFRGSPADVSRLLAAYAELGIDDLIVGLTPMNTHSLDRLAAARA